MAEEGERVMSLLCEQPKFLAKVDLLTNLINRLAFKITFQVIKNI